MVTQIYVIAIEGVSHRFIYNPDNVVDRINEFCNDDYEVTQVNTLEELDDVIRNPPEKLVLVNGHGETIPIPESWENWEEYIHQISNNVFQHGWIVVSICGMPLWCYSSDEHETDIEWAGINTFLENTGGRVNQNMGFGWCSLTPFGRKISRLYGEPVTNQLLCSRLLSFTNLSLITKSMYRIGEFSGVSAIKCGEGYLIHNGVLPSNITPQNTEVSSVTDEYVTLLSIIFTVGVLECDRDAEEIFESCKDNENSLRKKVIIPLLRLKGFNNVSDIHGSDEHGRDVVCFLNDRFGNRLNYAFQIKARQIHCNTGRSLPNNINSIMIQIEDAFSTPFYDPFANASKDVHVMYVITSKAITSQAKRRIVEGTNGNRRYIHFIDGGQLKEEWIRNYVF